MARRYSGSLIITITWDESLKKYLGQINAIGSQNLLPVRLQATPSATWQALDLPEIFDNLAYGALVFAADRGWPVDDYAEFDPAFDGTGREYVIRRTPWIRQLK